MLCGLTVSCFAKKDLSARAKVFGMTDDRTVYLSLRPLEAGSDVTLSFFVGRRLPYLNLHFVYKFSTTAFGIYFISRNV